MFDVLKYVTETAKAYDTEPRFVFRGQSTLSPEAGVIPVEFDELSDREREYYRTGPWSTRPEYRKGQLVQPGPPGVRQGYARKGSGKLPPWIYESGKKFRVRKEGVGHGTFDSLSEAKEYIKTENFKANKPGPKPESKRVQAIQEVVEEFNTMVMDDFNKGNLSKTPEFFTFLKKNYPKKLSSLYQSLDLIETQPLYTPDLRRNLMDKLVQEANAGEKFVEFGDLYAKVGESESVPVSRWREYVDRLDTRNDKISKVFDNIVNNNEALVATKEYSKGSTMAKSSLLKRAIAERVGIDSAETLMKGLNKNKFFKKNKDVIEYAFSYGFRQIPEGTTFNEIFEEGIRRKGGGVSWTRGAKHLIPDASRTVLEYARRHWNQNNLWGDKSQIEFFDKKGDPIVWKSGTKISPNQVSFTYGKSPTKWNLETLRKGGKDSGLFNEVYKTHQAYYNMMKTPVTNPKYPEGKKIPFGQLMRRTYRKGFDDWSLSPMAIDHEFGVKNKPFTNLRLASARTNAALRDIYKHVPQKGLQRKLVNELMSSVKGLKGKQLVEGLMTEGQQLAKQVLTEGYKSPHSAYTELGGKFLKPSKFKTLSGPEQKIIQRMAKAETYKIFKAFQANGVGGGCPIDEKAEGGRIGYFKGGSDQCMRNAINEHKRKLADNDPTAIKKQLKINQTKSMKNIFNLGSRGLRGLISVIGGWGGAAIEAAVEAGFYGYGLQQGESPEQARENLFLPKIIEKYVPDVIKDTELWKKYGIKPFKTGVWEGPEKLIEEELLAGNESAQEHAQGIKALEDEYANASKIDFELGIMKNPRRPAAPEDIEIKEQELRDSYGRIEELQIKIKEGTPTHDAYVAAQEKQKALRDERAQEHWGDSPAYKGSKQRQWQDEFLDYRGADRKYRKDQPFAFKGGVEANIGPTKEELAKGMNINWEEIFPRTIDTPRTTEQQKWDYIMNQGGFDLMDKISAAGGVANMAGGGIAGIRRPWAIPPESGPDPQGLASLNNYATKRTG
jgi:hypothetical protein